MTKLSRAGAGLALLLGLGSLGAGADGRALYERMRTELFKHNTYTVMFESYSARGRQHEIYARRTVAGKFIQKPKYYCGTFSKTEHSFPEQATDGYQECYTGSDDLNRLVLPGALRMVGVVTLFPEDPKAFYINGENLKYEALWEFFGRWDRMLDGGTIAAEPVQLEGRPHWLLTLRRGRIPDPDYHLDLCKIWVDSQTWFPTRIEYYRPGDPQAVLFYRHWDLRLDAPLTAKDMQFEGLTFGWNLARVSGGEGLDRLSAPTLKLAAGPAPELGEALAGLDQALSPVRDYAVTLATRFRYHRLRLIKEDRYQYLATEKAFRLETTRLAATYIMLGASAGSRLLYLPSRDPLIHLYPGGIYQVMGEQTFTRDDPRLFSSLGDNVQDLNFFALRDRVRGHSSDAEVRTAKSEQPAGVMIELKTKVLIGPREPKTMRLFLDPQTSLPLRVEFRDYDDPLAFCQVDFRDLKTNTGLTAEDILR